MFSKIHLHVKFDIIENMPLTDEWAMARTASSGHTTILAGGESQEANQELFMMKKVEGHWKIARYCFATTNPPK